jgi:hypothetical protein
MIGIEVVSHLKMTAIVTLKGRFQQGIVHAQDLFDNGFSRFDFERRRLIQFKAELLGFIAHSQELRIKGVVEISLEHLF